MIEKNKILLIPPLILTICSCNTIFIKSYTHIPQSSLLHTCKHFTVSTTNNKSIILISDTTLNYIIRFGGLGVSTTIEYTISDNELIVDTVDIYNRSSFQNIDNDIFGYRFYYYRDSLVGINNNELYYSNKFIKKEHNPSKSPSIYLVFNNKKYKLNRINRSRFKRIFSSEDYTLNKLCNKVAKEKYSIDLKSVTFEVINSEE